MKKCYLETFRFSEDLEFSLRLEAAYTAESLRALIGEAAASVHSGLSFAPDGIDVRAQIDRGIRYLKARFPDCEAWQISAAGEKRYRSPEGIHVAPAVELLCRRRSEGRVRITRGAPGTVRLSIFSLRRIR